MFISIPKSFFVPVLFSDEFTLNLESNNMEYDTNRKKSISYGYRTTIGEDVNSQNNMLNKDEFNKGQFNNGEEGTSEFLTEEAAEKAKVEKEINQDKETDKSNDNEILSEADEEFIHMKNVEG